MSSERVEKSAFIEKRRAEIFSDLARFIKRTKHPISAGEIIELVFHDEREEDDFEHYVMLLIDDNPEEADTAQELMMDLFNYFPRLSLKGKSFAEKVPFEELRKMEQAFREGTSYQYELPQTQW